MLDPETREYLIGPWETEEVDDGILIVSSKLKWPICDCKEWCAARLQRPAAVAEYLLELKRKAAQLDALEKLLLQGFDATCDAHGPVPHFFIQTDGRVYRGDGSLGAAVDKAEIGAVRKGEVMDTWCDICGTSHALSVRCAVVFEKLRAELAAEKAAREKAEERLSHLESWKDAQGFYHDLLNPECEVQSIIDACTAAERAREKAEERLTLIRASLETELAQKAALLKQAERERDYFKRLAFASSSQQIAERNKAEEELSSRKGWFLLLAKELNRIGVKHNLDPEATDGEVMVLQNTRAEQAERERDAMAAALDGQPHSHYCEPGKCICIKTRSADVLRAHDAEKDMEINALRCANRELRGINVEPGISLGKAREWKRDSALLKPAIEALSELLTLWSSFHGDSEDNDIYKPVIEKCATILGKLRKEQANG